MPWEKMHHKENNWIKFKRLMKAVWHFIWVEDSILSWIVNVLLAFIIKGFLQIIEIFSQGRLGLIIDLIILILLYFAVIKK